MENTQQNDLIKYAKSRAKKLRAYLETRDHRISHSESLEATAKADGYKDWNTYSALFKLAETELAKENTPLQPQQFPLHVGDRVRGIYRQAHYEGVLLGLEATINPGVWRVKMHFDTPVSLPSHKSVDLTRQRVRCMLNAEGISVNLKGTVDGDVTIELP